MTDDLPPPVTLASSKRAMWDEIQAMSEEIDSIHRQCQALERGQKQTLEELERWKNYATLLRWQLDMVQAALGRNIKAPE